MQPIVKMKKGRIIESVGIVVGIYKRSLREW